MLQDTRLRPCIELCGIPRYMTATTCIIKNKKNKIKYPSETLLHCQDPYSNVNRIIICCNIVSSEC